MQHGGALFQGLQPIWKDCANNTLKSCWEIKKHRKWIHSPALPRDVSKSLACVMVWAFFFIAYLQEDLDADVMGKVMFCDVDLLPFVEIL